MAISNIAKAFNIISVFILLAFSGTWISMILLTWDPGNPLLWYININASKIFAEAIHLMEAVVGFGVIQVAVLFSVVAAISLVLGRFSRASRFLSAHLAAGLVSLPLIRQLVASAGDDFGYLAASSGWSFDQFTQVDAVRLPMIVLAALACIAAHWEVLARAKRDKLARSRAVRLLAIH